MSHANAVNTALPLIVLLGIVTAFDAMAIDMYLPAFSQIGSDLGVETSVIQTSLSVFLVGLAIGQFLYGPLSDRYGRRLPLLSGILLFVAASAVIAASQNIETFMAGRFVQGLGGAAGLVIPRALVADMYKPREAAKTFSILMQIMMVAPVAAPPIGGLLLSEIGWRSIFWLLVVIGSAALIAGVKLIPETLKAEQRSKSVLKATLNSYAEMFRHRAFMAYVISGSFILAGMFVYIGSSAFIFTEYFGLPPTTYSFIFAAMAAGQIFFGFVNMKLLNHFRDSQILPVGLCLHLGFALLLVAAIMLNQTNLYLIGGLLFLALVMLAFIFGNVTSVVMAVAPVSSGSASSFFGVLQYVTSGIVGMILSTRHDGTLLPPLLAFFLCAFAALAAWQIARTKARQAQTD